MLDGEGKATLSDEIDNGDLAVKTIWTADNSIGIDLSDKDSLTEWEGFLRIKEPNR